MTSADSEDAFGNDRPRNDRNFSSRPNFHDFDPRRKKIILCFDGTGNKFSGTDADSNILKIFRMLDNGNIHEMHYYQPGIGTYVSTHAFSHTTWLSRFMSWYQKAKDSAVGTSFDDHVMGGYKFLMQAYTDDDIFIFGFSRGAYIARFLAEMLDHVGLLGKGNEEMARFAWKAFAQWQERQDKTPEEANKKKQMFDFMQAFRETFSRPVRRIRFLGLFDTVNSVPRFENAWMQRKKFPYTARSTAKIIRHAVSIDERRAKFRQDLISATKPSLHRIDSHKAHNIDSEHLTEINDHLAIPNGVNGKHSESNKPDRYRRPSQIQILGPGMTSSRLGVGSSPGRSRSTSPAVRSASPATSATSQGSRCASPASSVESRLSLQIPMNPDDADEDEADPQDIQEVWFPGCHADLGGGWGLSEGEEVSLSHGPLVWMVREAQNAGLRFDPEQMRHLKCCDDNYNMAPTAPNPGPQIPEIQIDGPGTTTSGSVSPTTAVRPDTQSPFYQALHKAATLGRIHDCLEFNNGLSASSVLSWKIMEYLPFRRMDLNPKTGEWQAISWPLPCGETRDIPHYAWIHRSAIERMKADENYRPGNLIIGGGGRGVRIAPKEVGTGEWEIHREEGDLIGEVYIRKGNGPSVNGGDIK